MLRLQLIYQYYSSNYYTNRSNGKSAICRYACKEKSTVSFPCELGTEIYNTFFVYNNYIFIQCGQNRIIKLDTNTNKVTTLFETQTGTIIMNCYQENVFFTINSHEDEKGIYWIDKSGHISKLTENEAIEIDILDEEYVYFIDMNYTIYRVKLSDLSLEKVF